jgi:diaminopimelate epimerase
MLPFVKTQALGNDFILVEQSDSIPPDLSTLARQICDRHFGVGGDGLIIWKQAGDRFPLRIFNRDGSEAECSGNGLRCVAAYLIGQGQWPHSEIRLETVSGLYTLKRVAGSEYAADMGTPGLAPDQIPFQAPRNVERVVNYPVKVGDREVRITACSTGNPHCSLFVDRLNEDDVLLLGPALERHSAFPQRTNVEFIHVLDRSAIEVAFWERGVGMTTASGTGSCGAAVACILNGKTGRTVDVQTRAGRLLVEWPENGRLKLTATANVVAEGSYWELPERE